MATINIFNDFAEQLAKGVHNFGSDTIKLFLSSTAPTADMDEAADLTGQIAYTNVSGGQPTVTIAVSDATDTVLSSDAVVVTATDTVPTFRYYGLYNDTSTGDKLICWWDHGSNVDLAAAETFTINFNNDPTAGTILTIGQGSIT